MPPKQHTHTSALTVLWLSNTHLCNCRPHTHHRLTVPASDSHPCSLRHRNPRDYFKLFDSAQLSNADGSTSHFELDVCKCVDTYVKVKRNQNQICWRWTKVGLGDRMYACKVCNCSWSTAECTSMQIRREMMLHVLEEERR